MCSNSTTEMFARSLILTFILIRIVLTFIFIYGSKHVPVSTVCSYIKYIYIRTNRVCNHLCNIKTRLCGCAAHCELSPESVFPLHLRLISIISTDLYIRAGFLRVEGNPLSQFRQFTCSRRLCISGLTFALKFVCSNQRIPSFLFFRV